MTTITLTLKPTSGGTFTVSLAPTATVGELRQAAQQHEQGAGADARFVFKGQVLRDDERTLYSYGAPRRPRAARERRRSGLLSPAPPQASPMATSSTW